MKRKIRNATTKPSGNGVVPDVVSIKMTPETMQEKLDTLGTGASSGGKATKEVNTETAPEKGKNLTPPSTLSIPNYNEVSG